jgi:hypothetical protein
VMVMIGWMSRQVFQEWMTNITILMIDDGRQ